MKTIAFEDCQNTNRKQSRHGFSAYFKRRVFSSFLLTFGTLAIFWFIARIL